MPSYTEEQKRKAVETVEECGGSVTRAIRRLGYPSRQTMYQCESESTPVPFTPLHRLLDGLQHVPRLELLGAKVPERTHPVLQLEHPHSQFSAARYGFPLSPQFVNKLKQYHVRDDLESRDDSRIPRDRRQVSDDMAHAVPKGVRRRD